MCRQTCLIRELRNLSAKAADRIRKILEITRGRAFVLFTSYAQMNEIYQRMLGEVEFPLLAPGRCSQDGAAGGVPAYTECSFVCHFIFLARRRCAGRTA